MCALTELLHDDGKTYIISNNNYMKLNVNKTKDLEVKLKHPAKMCYIIKHGLTRKAAL